MPNIKSQKDRMRLTAKQTVRNKSLRSALRTTIKKANASIDTSADSIAVDVKAASIALEKSVTKGLLHRNNASRTISRMMKKENAAKKA